MKKIILSILLCTSLLITGCNNKKQDEQMDNGYNDNLLKCLAKTLDEYILGDNKTIKEIDIKSITDKEDEIYYFRGAYTDNDHMYLIVNETNKTFIAEVMKDFEIYFSSKYPVYQKYIIDSEGITIYLHTPDNNVNFKDLLSKCTSSNNLKDGKNFPSNIKDKLNDTKQIIIRLGNKKIGLIDDKSKVDKILNSVVNSKQYGDVFLCDMYSFGFEMYDEQGNLIDTIYVWYDGKRIVPKSMEGGCSYYTVIDTDFRQIIEDETDYIFYGIIDLSNNYDPGKEIQCIFRGVPIYEDIDYEYSLNCIREDYVLVEFRLTNKVMNLKYALNNNYIDAKRIYKDYPSLLIRAPKGDYVLTYPNGLDINGELDYIIQNGPSISSNPFDYISENQEIYDELLNTPKETFEFAITSLINENASNGLKSYIEALLCLDINNNISFDFDSAPDFLEKYKLFLNSDNDFNAYDDYAIQLLNL